MKVTFIIFSPTGNTLKVARTMENSLKAKDVEVQLIDLTRDPVFFNGNNKDKLSYLNEKIKQHDLLCLGGPVYAHHLHFNILNIIKELPKPNEKWGKLATSFITYGGISSGLALIESVKLLKKSGRIPALAMKINSEHCMTKLKYISTKINEGMPGEEAIPFIEDFVEKIILLKNKDNVEILNIIPQLKYLKFIDRMKDKIIFREKIWQKYLYPKIFIDYNKCTKCGICSEICPVQRIEMTDKGPIIPKNSHLCVHCVSCMIHCPVEAITSNVNWNLYNKLLKEAAEGRGPIQTNEKPRSAVYG
ncbi:MAG: EFR1 family ferrodoxin [Candidatus Thorarchaeota archaeon]